MIMLPKEVDKLSSRCRAVLEREIRDDITSQKKEKSDSNENFVRYTIRDGRVICLIILCHLPTSNKVLTINSAKHGLCMLL